MLCPLRDRSYLLPPIFYQSRIAWVEVGTLNFLRWLVCTPRGTRTGTLSRRGTLNIRGYSPISHEVQCPHFCLSHEVQCPRVCLPRVCLAFPTKCSVPVSAFSREVQCPRVCLCRYIQRYNEPSVVPGHVVAYFACKVASAFVQNYQASCPI